jgi:3-oxoadipate enol-lactonase
MCYRLTSVPTSTSCEGGDRGPGDWTEWFAKWANLDRGQLDWAYRCLMERDDLTARLPEIYCPALIVHGTHDEAVPMGRASVLRSGLGGRTSFVAIEGGRHAANITHSVAVNVAMRSFLASIAD